MNHSRSGLIYGIVAYVCWGLVPLYFRELRGVSAGEILAHRIAWSLPLMLMITTLTPGGIAALRRTLASRRLVLTLLGSGALLAANWLLYIYGTLAGRVAEASLGYYMLPLVNAFLATLFLGERLRPAHWPALFLIAVGVSIPLFANGEFPWLAIALPITFGLYGFVRKRVPVDSGTGLTVETMLLLPMCLIYLGWLTSEGRAKFGPDPELNALIAFSGIVTVVPLLTYTLSIRRLPLLAQALIQFLSPTVQFLIAVLLFHEAMGPERWAAIGCVWAAVLIFILDAVIQERQRRRAVRESALPDHAGAEAR